MSNQPVSTASLSLPHKPYRGNYYVGNDVKVIVSLSGRDDGSVGTFVDRFTSVGNTAKLSEMLGYEHKDCVGWDWGCEPRNEFSSTVATVGFVDVFSQEHVDAFAKENPKLGITVYYENNKVVGHVTYRNGKVVAEKHTVQRWTLNDARWTEVSYAEYVKTVGEGAW